MPNEELFSGIPSLGDEEGLQNFMNQQTLTDLGMDSSIPAALEPAPTQQEPAPAPAPTAPTAPNTTTDNGTQFTSEQIQQIIARNAQLEAYARNAQRPNQPQTSSPRGAAEYNEQQATIIKQLIDKGVPLATIMQSLKGNTPQRSAIDNSLSDRIKAVEQYLQQQQYINEETKFVNKMTEFGNKFGLSEDDLVTFGNTALAKGINIANVTDVEAVFRAIYPEQYAIRVQRMSNAPSSQIFGGTSAPESPRATAAKLEDAYVDQFLKGAMPNAYVRKH